MKELIDWYMEMNDGCMWEIFREVVKKWKFCGYMYIFVLKICIGKFIFVLGVRKIKNMEFFFYYGKINVNL